MRSYIQFLTTPTADTPGTSLLLHFDSKRYLIGHISEGTQRACIERGTKLVKLSDIFLTGRVEWTSVGGLLGMVLTQADAIKSAAAMAAERDRQKGANAQFAKAKENGSVLGSMSGSTKKDTAPPRTLTIHGGTNLTHMLATARRFIFRKGMPLRIEELDDEGECSPTAQTSPAHPDNPYTDSDTKPSVSSTFQHTPTWSDENIQVWALRISLPSPGAQEAAVSSKSAKKRAFDEYAAADTLSSTALDESRDRDQQIRKAVVSEMFDSDWRLDALVEATLSDVKGPAAVFVRNAGSGHIEEYKGPVPWGAASTEEDPPYDIKVLVRKPWPGALIETLPPTNPSSTALSYIIKNHYQRGKFLPRMAAQLGVKPGPQFSQLAQGKSVTAEGGRVVTPDMVLEKGKVGGGVAVVDLPTTDYVEGLIGRAEWKASQVMEGVGAIIWILGPGVGDDERLRRFVGDLPQLKHVVSSRDYCPNYLAFDSAAKSAIRLHQVDPLRFPVPVHDNIALPQPGSRQGSASEEAHSPFIAARRGEAVQLEPSVEMQDALVQPFLNTAKVWQDTPGNVLDMAREGRVMVQRHAELDQEADLPGKNVEIIALGTGSALPSKHRNVSATLLRVPGYGSYLIDCGENTLGQLRRVLEPEQLAEVLRDLKAIWISHLHADHHLGTVAVIKARYEELRREKSAEELEESEVRWRRSSPLAILEHEKPLFVISDEGMVNWLGEYASVEDFGYGQTIPLLVKPVKDAQGRSTRLTWNGVELGFNTPDARLNKAMTTAMGVSDIQAVSVSHCHDARAVTLSFPDGFKFSYSGDCRPSRAFAEIGRGSTVLLHEATFDDELKGDAVAKRHSTTSEALGVGIAMGARRVLLTHFSQRYQKIPVMDALDGAELQLETDLDAANAPDGAVNAYLMPTQARTMPDPSGEVITVKKAAVRDMKVAVAFDYMRVKVGEIAHLEHFSPALRALFEAAEEEGEEQEVDEEETGGEAKKKKKPRENKGSVSGDRAKGGKGSIDPGAAVH
ncbi:MAG: Zinc phosphodiesterase ELAC protein 2 [Thelocarpon impressellum]|nr:MAG: Zinc phosphodiesterase ELAC protein 2 [Thelocarpon impressellum]